MPALSAIKRVHAGRQSLEGYILGLGPIGFWRWNEVNGTVAEDIGSGGNNGTYTNGPTLGTLSPIPPRILGVARAASFDGVDQYVTIADQAVLRAQRPMSVMAWIFRDATGEEDYIFWKRGDANKGWVFRIESSDKIGLAFFGVALVVGNTGVPAGWSHVAATVSAAGNVICYLNGAADGTNTLAAPSTTTQPLLIAARTTTSGTIDGYSDQRLALGCRLNRVLTAAEIEAAYLIGKNGA